MTITEEDWETFNRLTTGFSTQHEQDSCFPTCVKNILDELADRTGSDGLRHSISDIADQFEYQHGRASKTDRIPSRLDPLIESAGYETRVFSGLDFNRLEALIQNEEWSLPICELHSRYFDDIRELNNGYTPEGGRDQYGRYLHTVIPFKHNSTNILFFDPFLDWFSMDDDAQGFEVQTSLFYEWWSRPEKRWTMWIEPTDQASLRIWED